MSLNCLVFVQCEWFGTMSHIMENNNFNEMKLQCIYTINDLHSISGMHVYTTVYDCMLITSIK